jgi:glycosyltransferase involved in cell wall biosynthesis
LAVWRGNDKHDTRLASKTAMRIALVVPGGVDRSGEYRVIPVLLALIGRLARDNDVQVFALSQEAEAGEWPLAGARIHNIGGRHTVLRAVRAICAMHRERPFDLIHAIWSGGCGLIAAAAAMLLAIPSVVHIAGGELVSMPDIGYGGRLTSRGRLREALNLRAASVVTAASSPVIDAAAGLGVMAQRVPLGVDLARWPPREPIRRDPDRPVKLIHIASLNRVKDQSTLLQALASLDRRGLRFEMDIVGEDTLYGRIQAMTVQLGLAQRVRFRGFLTQRELRPLVEGADLMIHSSRHESGPVALLEAAVVGVPTVGTGVGHLREWAPHAAAAVPVGNWSALADAVGSLLEDEDLRERMAWKAQQRALREDADYTAQCFLEIYANLI